MLIRRSIAAAFITLMAAPAVTGQNAGEPILAGAGDGAPVLAQDSGAGRGTVPPQQLRKKKAAPAPAPEAASPAAGSDACHEELIVTQ